MNTLAMSHPYTGNKGPVVEIARCLILGAVYLDDQQRRMAPELDNGHLYLDPLFYLRSSAVSNSIGTILDHL
jgi:hypothetical protein